MATGKRSILLVIIFLLGIAFIPVVRLSAASGPIIDRAGGRREQVEVELHAGAAPAPGQVTELVLEAKPLADVPDLKIEWQVPEGADLIGAAEEHLGFVSAGQTVTSTRQVRFGQEGVFKVVGAAVLDYGPDRQYGASGVVFYTISPVLSRVSDKDPADKNPMRTIMPAEISSYPITVSPNTTNDDPCFTVKGTITRTERSPQPGGYMDSTGVPVSNAYVEIREEDIVFDDSYADILTNSDGFFQASFCDDDGVFDDELEIYVRLHAEIYDSDYLVAEIEDSSWIDENYEFDTNPKSSEGGTLTFNISLNTAQSAIFNIGDAVLDAWRSWRDFGGEKNGEALFDEEGEVHWEPGYGDDKSYYNPTWGEITLADDPSDPDAWDDSVIIHEWGHMADDIYSCDDNPGGDHNVGELAASKELAWGEGYPDYWQSVVRTATNQPFSTRYIDINGTGTGGINESLEVTQSSDLVSVQYELAIAGALWDLVDTNNDDQDTVSFNHSAVQEVYTSEEFNDADDCDFDAYATAWVDLGKPATGPVAAAIMQNTGYTLAPTNLVDGLMNVLQVAAPPEPSIGIWWNRLIYAVDNSKSMAGAKYDAVKTVLGEAINDLGAEPEGTEFTLQTFNNTALTNKDVFAGQFFPNRLTPTINLLTTNTTNDPACSTFSLLHLYQAIKDKDEANAWLFTDGDTVQYPTVENMKKALNDRHIRASVALMGVCPAPFAEAATTEPSPEYQQLLSDALNAGVDEATITERANIEIAGALVRYFGLTGAAVPGGVVPYLLTAIDSGGNFLFVDPSQTAEAADILRAQITHSAGAGTWSDYVSDTATYRYDELASWEYDWIDAAVLGTDHGTPPSNGFVPIALPGPFIYYGSQFGYTSARTYENGYITLGSLFFGNQPANTTLPNPAAPNNALYPYWDDLRYELICLSAPQIPLPCGLTGKVYSHYEAPWFVIEHKNYFPATKEGSYMNFETQLNLESGEIRYLYQDPNHVGAPSATIGLENSAGSSAVQVSFNDINGSADGTGYKFIPALPQPTKVYSATVDAEMSGIAFLLTGYSGTFEDLVVKYPNGQQVSCNDTANVLCLDLGLVQYVQADVDGRFGEWQAIVDAGPSGEGTFSLFSMAASAITANTISPHQLSTALNNSIVVNLGHQLAGNMMNGQFMKPNDVDFGLPFNLFDDGAHNDDLPGDGIFGSDPFIPPEAGSAYLVVSGEFAGTNFKRSDPIPFSFQPLTLESLGDGANYGGQTELQFELTNLDTVAHKYFLNSSIPLNWSIDGVFGSWDLNPGESTTISAFVTMGPDPANLPSGTSGEVILTAVEAEKGIMADTASAVVTRRRPPVSIDIQNAYKFMRPGGEKVMIEFLVVDEQGVGVADGTEVQLSATLGTIDPSVAFPKNGYFIAEFTSGDTPGTAVITAQVDDAVMSKDALVTAQTEIEIGTPPGNQIILAVDASALPPGAQTKVTATVIDRYGMPVAAQEVRIGVEGNNQLGTVGSAQEVITGMTDSNGQIETQFTAGEIPGKVKIRAEMLLPEGDKDEVVHEDSETVFILGGIYMPIIRAD